MNDAIFKDIYILAIQECQGLGQIDMIPCNFFFLNLPLYVRTYFDNDS